MMNGLPLVSLETDAYLSVGNKNGAFNQHAVGGQQGYLLIQAHAGKLVFQLHALVKQSTGIKKFPGWQPALFNPPPQFFCRGVLFHNVAILIRNSLVIKPLFCFLAGRAFGIFNK